MISASSSTVLGFSLTGAVIKRSSGTLLENVNCSENQLDNFIFSAPGGTGLTVIFDDGGESEEAFYNVELEPTGEFQLVILESSISILELGDEVGIFDNNGVVESCSPDDGCSNPIYGEVLVGSGTWTGAQLEISAIVSVDLSDFGGPVTNGAVDGNEVSIKIWKTSEQIEYDVSANWSTGNGYFGDLILATNELEIVEEPEIVINEFFFRAASGTSVPDYIELFNYGTNDIDLTGWTIMGEDLSGTISAGSHMLIAGEDPFFNSDGDELYAGEDIDNSVFADISLSSSSDEIDLLDANGDEVDYVEYGDGWTLDRGHAVELINPSIDNSDPMNWVSADSDCLSDLFYGEDGDDEDLENFGSPSIQNCSFEGKCYIRLY